MSRLHQPYSRPLFSRCVIIGSSRLLMYTTDKTECYGGPRKEHNPRNPFSHIHSSGCQPELSSVRPYHSPSLSRQPSSLNTHSCHTFSSNFEPSFSGVCPCRALRFTHPRVHHGIRRQRPIPHRADHVGPPSGHGKRWGSFCSR